jgi:hypothetical protein
MYADINSTYYPFNVYSVLLYIKEVWIYNILLLFNVVISLPLVVIRACVRACVNITNYLKSTDRKTIAKLLIETLDPIHIW